MLRKAIIFISLLSAYLLMLGHDIIPHHHHDHVNIEHHHDHHNDSENEGDDHDALPDFFAKFSHAPYQAPANTAVSLIVDAKEYTAELNNDFTAIPIPPDISNDQPDPPEDVGHVRDIRVSSPGLRAPPAF